MFITKTTANDRNDRTRDDVQKRFWYWNIVFEDREVPLSYVIFSVAVSDSKSSNYDRIDRATYVWPQNVDTCLRDRKKKKNRKCVFAIIIIIVIISLMTVINRTYYVNKRVCMPTKREMLIIIMAAYSNNNNNIAAAVWVHTQ